MEKSQSQMTTKSLFDFEVDASRAMQDIVNNVRDRHPKEKIYFVHVRKTKEAYDSKYGQNYKEYVQNKGRTFAFKYVLGAILYAEARCGKNDHFCKKVGRAIAEGRLNKGNAFVWGEKTFLSPDAVVKHFIQWAHQQRA